MPRRGQCMVCSSPLREEIEARLRRDESLTAIAAWTCTAGDPLSRDVIGSHKRHMLAVAAPVGQQTAIAEARDVADRMLAEVERAVTDGTDADEITRRALLAVIAAGIVAIRSGSVVVNTGHVLTALDAYARRYAGGQDAQLARLTQMLGVSVTVNVQQDKARGGTVQGELSHST